MCSFDGAAVGWFTETDLKVFDRAPNRWEKGLGRHLPTTSRTYCVQGGLGQVAKQLVPRRSALDLRFQVGQVRQAVVWKSKSIRS